MVKKQKLETFFFRKEKKQLIKIILIIIVNWTEEGHRFSWRMKLRDKAGMAMFWIVAPDGKNKKKQNKHEPKQTNMNKLKQPNIN